MDLSLIKVLPRNRRPGIGAIWQFKYLPQLQITQGLKGGREWALTRSGDGYFFLHDGSPAEQATQLILERLGRQSFRTRTDLLDCVHLLLMIEGLVHQASRS